MGVSSDLEDALQSIRHGQQACERLAGTEARTSCPPDLQRLHGGPSSAPTQRILSFPEYHVHISIVLVSSDELHLLQTVHALLPLVDFFFASLSLPSSGAPSPPWLPSSSSSSPSSKLSNLPMGAASGFGPRPHCAPGVPLEPEPGDGPVTGPPPGDHMPWPGMYDEGDSADGYPAPAP